MRGGRKDAKGEGTQGRQGRGASPFADQNVRVHDEVLPLIPRLRGDRL
jgi:hypothetical protein